MIISINEYLRVLKSPNGLFRSLRDFRLLEYHVGNSAIVCKIEFSDGRCRMLKCYLRSKPHLREIYGDKLLTDEIFIPYNNGSGCWVDVVLDSWHDGTTLSQAIRLASLKGDSHRLEELATAFDRLALQLLREDWAHGDLKPDNIIVGDDLSLHLIDLDACYMPSLNGSKSIELGTAAWQHPERLACDFDRHIDDYSIALISTTLHALAIEPSLYEKFADAEGVLLHPAQIIRGSEPLFEQILHIFASKDMAAQLRIAQLLDSRAYILPRLATLLHYSLFTPSQCDTTPELLREAGLWGYAANGNVVTAPLYDLAFTPRNGTAHVVLHGYNHTISFKM